MTSSLLQVSSTETINPKVIINENFIDKKLLEKIKGTKNLNIYEILAEILQ